jgi:hypothetical protein
MSLFAKAQKLEKPAVSTKATKETIEVAGLEDYAKLDALGKNIAGVQKTVGATIKDEVMADLFYNKAMADGELPESLEGVEGIAKASLECRKRGTNSPLSDQEVEVFTTNGLTPTKAVITHEAFLINPKYTNDMKLLAKINKLLEGKVPEDLFVTQDEVSKYVVTDELVKEACALKDKLPREVFMLMTVLAIKPKLSETNIGQIIDDVKPLIVEEVEEEKPAAKKAAKKAAK